MNLSSLPVICKGWPSQYNSFMFFSTISVLFFCFFSKTKTICKNQDVRKSTGGIVDFNGQNILEPGSSVTFICCPLLFLKAAVSL